MGWLSTITISKLVFLTLVWAFYLRMTYGMGSLITSTVRGVEICLDSESICHIFDIAPIRLRVYKSKIWPIIPGFEPREAIKMICGLPDAHGMGKPLTHNLLIISKVLHHMLCFFFLPQGGHWDEASYYKAFFIDSIITRRRVHLRYLMMMHIIACCESITHVLPLWLLHFQSIQGCRH